MKGKVIERMSTDETSRMVSLINRLILVIEVDTDFSYQDVMRALEKVRNYYEEKGYNLLNSVKIQEVAKFGEELSHPGL